MGRLPKELEEKRLRLESAARRGAFENYVRHGRVPEAYERIAALVNEAKRLDAGASVGSLPYRSPAGLPTTHYVWRTVGDDRVRDTHAALNGQVFSWADPPSTVIPVLSRIAAAGRSHITAIPLCPMQCWRWCESDGSTPIQACFGRVSIR